MEILDMICADYGNRIIAGIEPKEKNKIESIITKILGVLQEDGIYAFALYSKSKGGIANSVSEEALNFLKDNKIKLLPPDCNDIFIGIKNNLASDIDKLFLAKELLERTLVYARYHAKALGGE